MSEYLRCWNATEAAIRAGYSEQSAYSIGWENLRKPEINSEIQRNLTEHTMSAEEAMARLSAQGRVSMQDLLDPDTGSIDLTKAVETGAVHAIKKYKHIVGKLGDSRVEVELYDSQNALLNIWKNQRVLQGLPTEIIGILPAVQELYELIAAQGQDPATVFNRMIAKLHAQRIDTDGR